MRIPFFSSCYPVKINLVLEILLFLSLCGYGAEVDIDKPPLLIFALFYITLMNFWV